LLLSVYSVLLGLLLQAVRSVLTDGRFRLPSPSAEAARKTAEALVAWLEDAEHKKLFDQFAASLIAKFKLCFSTTQKTKRLKQAKMWGEYHQLRSSPSFFKE